MFRSAYRLFAIWSLLAMMVLVITPGSAWHHHAEEDGAHHEHPSGAAIGTECPVCDHVLPVAVEATVIAIAPNFWIAGIESASALPLTLLGHESRTADRGPPVGV